MPNPSRRLPSLHQGASPAPRGIPKLINIHVGDVYLFGALTGAGAARYRWRGNVRMGRKNDELAVHVGRGRVEPRSGENGLDTSGLPALFSMTALDSTSLDHLPADPDQVDNSATLSTKPSPHPPIGSPGGHWSQFSLVVAIVLLRLAPSPPRATPFRTAAHTMYGRLAPEYTWR